MAFGTVKRCWGSTIKKRGAYRATQGTKKDKKNKTMQIDTEPIKKLLRKFDGNLLTVPIKQLISAFKLANGDMEETIDRANDEYLEEQEERDRQDRP